MPNWNSINNWKLISSITLSLAMAFSFAVVTTACTRVERSSALTMTASAAAVEQTQSPAVTMQSFKVVEGPDLKARLEAARTLASGQQTPYWSAYSFDVRSGVAVDPSIHEFHGSMNTIGDTSVFFGTTAGGMTVETRNLAIFLLRNQNDNQITRIEIYNLERKREYSGYPVYWLGRANNEESLTYLRGLMENAPNTLLTEREVLAISLHDDKTVASLLKGFIRNSQNQRVRSSSVFWLGQVGGEEAFLADLVRNDSENRKLRRQAAHAIGESRDRTALALLQTLYDSVKDAEIHRSIVQAAGNSDDHDAAFNFMLKVAKNDPDREARKTAIRQMSEFERPGVVEELTKIYNSDSDVEVKRTVLHAVAETKSPGAQALLLNLARSEPNADLRRHAIRVISERGEAVVEDLIKLYDGESNTDVRRTILQSLSEIKSTRVEDKLFAVAKEDANVELRRHAVRLLGERAGKRSLEFLGATAQNDSNTEVQIQAVRAISERPADEAIPLLLKIARTHSNPLVRRQAIRSLGESGDPRAAEFFREVLAK